MRLSIFHSSNNSYDPIDDLDYTDNDYLEQIEGLINDLTDHGEKNLSELKQYIYQQEPSQQHKCKEILHHFLSDTWANKFFNEDLNFEDCLQCMNKAVSKPSITMTK